MKLVLLAILVASLQSDTTALVEASKEAKAKKKSGTTTTKVITNADVKKSKGKLTVRPATNAPEVKPEPTLMEKQAAERAAAAAKEAKRAELQTTIDALEKEVAALEASYYAANDLDYRDNVIAKRFAEKKTKLDAAKKQLATLSGAAPASGAEFSREPTAEAAAAPQKP